jgi:CRP-like cAMP-binding protein
MHTSTECKDYTDLLQTIPALSSCTRSVLEDFSAHGVVTAHCDAGSSLSLKTIQDRNLYVLIAGSALLNADDNVSVSLEPGDYFGRNPASQHQLSASVVAVSDVELLVISQEEIIRLGHASSRDRHPSKIEWRIGTPAVLRQPSRRLHRRTARAGQLCNP